MVNWGPASDAAKIQWTIDYPTNGEPHAVEGEPERMANGCSETLALLALPPKRPLRGKVSRAEVGRKSA